jgi:hypothetical protein
MGRKKKIAILEAEIAMTEDSVKESDTEIEEKEKDEKIVLAEEELDLDKEEERMIKKFAERYKWSDEYGKYIQIVPLVPGGIVPEPTKAKKKKV